jgi:hypothetical protein
MRVIVDLLAFGEASNYSFELPDCFCGGNLTEILELIFVATNTYSGPVWDQISPNLPAVRSHTAISPGDWITFNVDGEYLTWQCEPVGWRQMV